MHKFSQNISLLLLYSFEIFCNYPPRRWGLISLLSLLYYPSNALTVPTANSLPLRFHGTLHYLRDTIRINKATIRGSCYSNPQKGMPTVIVNNRSASFPVCLLHKNSIKRDITTIFVLYGLLIRASNSKSKAVSIDGDKKVHNILSPLFSSSKHPMTSRGFKNSPHQDCNQGARVSDISVAPFPNGKKL